MQLRNQRHFSVFQKRYNMLYNDLLIMVWVFMKCYTGFVPVAFHQYQGIGIGTVAENLVGQIAFFVGAFFTNSGSNSRTLFIPDAFTCHLAKMKMGCFVCSLIVLKFWMNNVAIFSPTCFSEKGHSCLRRWSNFLVSLYQNDVVVGSSLKLITQRYRQKAALEKERSHKKSVIAVTLAFILNKVCWAFPGWRPDILQ